MKTLSAVIAEDLELARQDLEELLQLYCPHINVCAWTKSAEEVLPLLRKHKADVLFLDLSLEGKNAMEVLQPVYLDGTSIIVVTGKEQIEKNVVRPETVAYLTKPIEPTELMAAVQKVKPIEKPNALFPDRLRIANKSGVHLIDLEDLIWLEASGNKTLLHLRTNAEPVTTSKTLKSFESLSSGGDFYRIHHSFLIHLRHVKNYVTSDGGWVTMSDGAHLSISRNRLNGFLEKISHRVLSV